MMGGIFVVVCVALQLIVPIDAKSRENGNKTSRATLRQQTQSSVLKRLLSSYKSFSKTEELIDAVDAYMANDGRVRQIEQTYGPLPDWDVSNITNFGGLFNAGRNPNAQCQRMGCFQCTILI